MSNSSNKVNMFAEAAAKRQAEQAFIKSQCGLNVEQKGVITRTPKKKVRLDITVPVETKNRLISYAEKKGLSSSVVIQMLIDEHCAE